MSTNPNKPVSSGVQELIDRLRQEGVTQGRDDGEKIVDDAEHRAQWLISQAKEEAGQIIEKAKQDADFLRHSGREALQLAQRDALLNLKEQLGQQFAVQLQRILSNQLQDVNLIRDLVLEIAGTTRRDNEAVTLLLPQDAMDTSKEKNQAQDPLTELVRNQTEQLLAAGVTLEVGSQRGLRLVLDDGQVQVDLNEQTLADLLLKHLQPRFRTLLEGLVS